MKRNSRFALALHTLSHMAAEPDRVRTSASIAEHARTNAVVVRRVLGKLRSAGLLRSEKGPAGGWRLARASSAISLADVYLALEERLLVSDMQLEANGCHVEHALHRRVSVIFDEVEHNLIARLSSVTIEGMSGR